jgi:hypothetical protein
MTQAKRGMGTKAANELLEKALGKPFGITINKIMKAGLLSADLERRFDAIRKERNWIAHDSRAQSRNAIHSDQVAEEFIRRLDAIAEESKALLNEIGLLAEQHVKKFGINQQQIEKKATIILEQWHDPNGI